MVKPKTTSDYLTFWGKARPDHDTSQPFHPAAYHCLDVAACGRLLLMQNDIWRIQLGKLLQLDNESLISFITFMLALHDIGKFSKPFQGIVPQHWPESCLGPYQGGSSTPRHDTTGWWLWRQNKLDAPLSNKLLNIEDGKFDPLMRAVMGHHGTPPQEDTSLYRDIEIGESAIKAARSFAQDVATLLLPLPVDLSSIKGTKPINNASWLLAGLTTLADWIGSNQSWFAYHEPEYSLEEYWQKTALKNAPEAVSKAGLSPRKCTASISYNDIAKITEPSPMQNWAETIPLTKSPGLYLIEDMTGSGKTEAALMLAHRLMAEGKADGLFFALPTMATANAMYERLENAYTMLFEKGAKPSLVLAHGARDMMEKFTSSILSGFESAEEMYGNNSDDESPDDTNMTASAQCAAWVADDRRLTFLADIGAGTIDQALLSILPSRHQSLRLAGLMRRVLILDEVHAYDAYMQQQIKTLLEFHCALGGSAVLLSATLPKDMKESFCEAYGGDADTAKYNDIQGMKIPYPLATIASVEGIQTQQTKPRKGSPRAVPVKFLASPYKGLEKVREAAKEGQAVLYIRNTVNDAIDTFNTLSGEVDHISLFHARYAFCDRLRQEEKALKTFGKNSTEQDRRGQVLIATQVVEQSLDVDFDLIISDLAPVDLLIQRAGRLWRHKRPNRPGKCELYVVSPALIANPGENWVNETLPGTAAVYPNHARLWLTAHLLKKEGEIKSPGNLRDLIEGVYGEEAEQAIPEGLKNSFYDFLGQQGADRGLGNMNTLNVSSSYSSDGGRWGSDEYTPTRLGEPTTTFRLARVQDGRLHPWAEDGKNSNLDPLLLWRLSEVNLRRSLADESHIPKEQEKQAKAIINSWGKWQDDKKLLNLTKSDHTHDWRGSVQLEGKQRLVIYKEGRGLQLV